MYLSQLSVGDDNIGGNLIACTDQQKTAVILCYLLYLFVGCNHSAHKFGSEVLCPEF
jgi:hypothetical protein